MSEETITWENSPIAQVYNPDGSPKDTAAAALTEMGREDIAGHALRNGQDIFTALKTGKDAAAFASSKMEGVIKLPGEDATEDQRAQFNKSLGALDNKEDYLKGIWPETLPEGFVKDEGLASILADHAVASPVLTADSAKDLAAKFMAHQQEEAARVQGEELEALDKRALETREALTVELGGKAQFEKFASDVKDMFTGKDLQDMGFKFQKGDDGKLTSENPLHASMMSDPAILRLLGSVVESKKAAGIPGGGSGGSRDSGDHKKQASQMERDNPNGFKNQEDLDKYNSLLGIK